MHLRNLFRCARPLFLGTSFVPTLKFGGAGGTETVLLQVLPFFTCKIYSVNSLHPVPKSKTKIKTFAWEACFSTSPQLFTRIEDSKPTQRSTKRTDAKRLCKRGATLKQHLKKAGEVDHCLVKTNFASRTVPAQCPCSARPVPASVPAQCPPTNSRVSAKRV